EAEALAAGMARPMADTLAAEVLPLADAAQFLVRSARAVLAPQRLRRGRPLWLMGVRQEIRREPRGAVLILGPANYPLFLPGAQALQALAAGNAVCVKPAPGASAPMLALADLLRRAGLPEGVLEILDEEAGPAAGADGGGPALAPAGATAAAGAGAGRGRDASGRTAGRRRAAGRPGCRPQPGRAHRRPTGHGAAARGCVRAVAGAGAGAGRGGRARSRRSEEHTSEL